APPGQPHQARPDHPAPGQGELEPLPAQVGRDAPTSPGPSPSGGPDPVVVRLDPRPEFGLAASPGLSPATPVLPGLDPTFVDPQGPGRLGAPQARADQPVEVRPEPRGEASHPRCRHIGTHDRGPPFSWMLSSRLFHDICFVV